MSKQYPGGIISKTAPVPSGSFENSTAPGIWTLEQQAYWQKLGQWPIPGNVVAYIEDVFSTYLYTANNSAQTITNGIDLAGKGGLVWGKSRSASQNHRLYDTARGSSFSLISNATSAESNQGTNACAFNADGFSLSAASGIVGGSGFGGPDYVSWTFRKQPKFFDVVTYTGNGTDGRTIAHNLGSVPGCMIVKRTNSASEWAVYHRSLGATKYMWLNDTTPEDISAGYWNDTTPTSSVFTVGSGGRTNGTGNTYVAYLFAHDAGGFGATGSDNVISCGSFTTDGSSNFSATLGFEPQWVMIKRYNTTGNWLMFDNMRGMGVQGISQVLYADVSNAEAGPNSFMAINSTGFNGTIGSASQSYIYIAIRRGPMRVPTSGTSVFSPLARTGNGVATTITGVGFAPDLFLTKQRQANDNGSFPWYDKLRGTPAGLLSTSTSSERTSDVAITAFLNNGVVLGNGTGDGGTWSNASGYPYINYFFGRAPGFFDEVCYTGNGEGANNQTHNLGVVPEMCILRRRSSAANWQVVHKNDGVTAASLALNLTNATISTSVMSANFTSTYFKTADATCWYEASNGNTSTFVAWLFATCPGVSKVGNYTGTGTLTTINCGFTGGARFVLIKRTDSTSNWFVWDTARGMTTGTDPSLTLNTTSAEVNANSVFTIATGFQLLASPSDDVNTNGGTYIFLAIA